MRSDTVAVEAQTSPTKGLLAVAKDKRLWIFAFMQHMHLAADGFNNFVPTTVQTLGFSRTISLVLTCPPYLIAGIIAIY